MALSKPKALTEMAAERTVEGHWNAVRRLGNLIIPYENENAFSLQAMSPNHREPLLLHNARRLALDGRSLRKANDASFTEDHR